MSASVPVEQRKNKQRGFSLIEVFVASTLLVLSSLSMAYTVGASGIASRASDRTLSVQRSLENMAQTLDAQPFNLLLSWNGSRQDFGVNAVTVSANLVEVGLVLVEYTVTENATGAVLARAATFRSDVD